MKTCPECGGKFFGRVDKIYCSTICRTAHHNKKKQLEYAKVRKTNSILRRNRNILLNAYLNNGNKIHKKELTYSGFVFNHFTHTLETQRGFIFFVYDCGFLSINDQEYELYLEDEQRMSS